MNLKDLEEQRKKRKQEFFDKVNKKRPNAKVKFDENFAENLKAFLKSKHTKEKPTE